MTCNKSYTSNLNLVQSGGLPGAFASMPFVGTAPIIESGSNSNGSWIKYADGTMITTQKLNFPTVSSQRLYSLTSDRPQTFIEILPFTVASSGAIHGASIYTTLVTGLNSGTNSSKLNLWAYLVEGNPPVAGITCGVIAITIGRWKA